MSGVLLEIKGLEKTFPGVRALKGVQLTVNKGEAVSYTHLLLCEYFTDFIMRIVRLYIFCYCLRPLQ